MIGELKRITITKRLNSQTINTNYFHTHSSRLYKSKGNRCFQIICTYVDTSNSNGYKLTTDPEQWSQVNNK